MPAESLKEKHMSAMALAIKHGHKIEGIDPETLAQLHKMADSMSEATLHEFATRKPKHRTVLTGGGRS